MIQNTLLVDTGHTRTKFAHCRDVSPDRLPEVVRSQAVMNDAAVDWNAIRSWFPDRPPDAALVTGTNLKRARILLGSWYPLLPAPMLLEDKQQLPLSIEVDFPQKVGVDRLLNTLAANVLRQPGQPAICIDSGTAITVDVVSSTGAFTGGAILPGILLGAKSLHLETTTLPHINVWDLLKRETAILGKNTEAAIASGLYWGHLGAVRELLTRYREALREQGPDPLLLVTGGAAGILTPYLPELRHEPSLSLQGLAVAARTLCAVV